MRTCCPDCATVFRISAEQLRARNGMVRCGQCRGVFNAFDSLIEEASGNVPSEIPARIPDQAAPPPEQSVEAPMVPESEPALPDITDNLERLEVLRKDLERALEKDIPQSPEPESEPESSQEPDLEPVAPAEPELDSRLDPIDAALQSKETPEESSRAARDAGMAAVRELSESPGYDRWAAGTLHLDASGRIIGESAKRPVWPFAMAVVLLLIVLLGQLAYHFRSELTQRMPSLLPVYAALNISIPLPRQVDLVTIETSDLQSDNARGLLVLQATLKNRAPYAQAWPALELTLTDTNDTVVARRVLTAADYLPPKADQQSFAAASEIGLKLWLESKQPAAGYRLYVFYP